MERTNGPRCQAADRLPGGDGRGAGAAHAQILLWRTGSPVYRDAGARGCPEDVRRAGMFHSIYGTQRFQGFTLPLERRGEVREPRSATRPNTVSYLNCAWTESSFDRRPWNGMRSRPSIHRPHHQRRGAASRNGLRRSVPRASLRLAGAGSRGSRRVGLPSGRPTGGWRSAWDGRRWKHTTAFSRPKRRGRQPAERRRLPARN